MLASSQKAKATYEESLASAINYWLTYFALKEISW